MTRSVSQRQLPPRSQLLAVIRALSMNKTRGFYQSLEKRLCLDSASLAPSSPFSPAAPQLGFVARPLCWELRAREVANASLSLPRFPSGFLGAVM